MFSGLIIFKALVSYTGTVNLICNCEIDPNYTKKNQIIKMFHVTDTIDRSVSLAIHTILMFVLPPNAVMMLRSSL